MFCILATHPKTIQFDCFHSLTLTYIIIALCMFIYFLNLVVINLLISVYLLHNVIFFLFSFFIPLSFSYCYLS